MAYKVGQLDGIVMVFTVNKSDSPWLCGVDQRRVASRDVNLDQALFTQHYGCVFTSDVALDLDTVDGWQGISSFAVEVKYGCRRCGGCEHEAGHGQGDQLGC